MEHETAKQLHVERPLAKRAPRRLAGEGEGFGECGIQRDMQRGGFFYAFFNACRTRRLHPLF